MLLIVLPYKTAITYGPTQYQSYLGICLVTFSSAGLPFLERDTHTDILGPLEQIWQHTSVCAQEVGAVLNLSLAGAHHERGFPDCLLC